MAYKNPQSSYALATKAAYQRLYRARYRQRNREHLREYHRKWSAENRERLQLRQQREYWRDPERSREIARAHAASYRERRTVIIAEAKNHPCTDCGIQFPFFVMDFDHVRGEKKFTIGQRRSVSCKALLEEISKCDLVCSNCHRIRTWAKKFEAITTNT